MDKQTREIGMYYALSQAGLEMVAPLGIGIWIDCQFGWYPWATVILAILGFVGGTIHLIAMAQRIEREQEKNKNEP
jgi:F0F1-type ATP synthase assembly protein I